MCFCLFANYLSLVSQVNDLVLLTAGLRDDCRVVFLHFFKLLHDVRRLSYHEPFLSVPWYKNDVFVLVLACGDIGVTAKLANTNTNDTLTTVVENIKKARLRRNIRAEILAERTGISADTLSAIEKVYLQ